MNTVKITFVYEPDEPDEDDATGMSEDEYTRVTDAVMQLGGCDIQCEKNA